MYALDLLDRKILAELDKNSRQPYSVISKKARSSRTVVEYRIKNLFQKGIISSLSAFIDPAKFGFTSWKVYIQLYNKNKATEEKITEFLQKNNKVWWAILCEGDFDLMFASLTKNVHEFYRLLSEFQVRFSKYESRIEVTTHINPDFFSRGYLLNNTSKKVCDTFLKDPEEIKLDKLDIEILKQLANNARIPSTELALKLKTTPRIVIYRIKELLNKKVITHFRLVPNVNSLNLDYYKVMVSLKDLNEERERKFKHFLEMHPNIINYSNSWGPWEIEFEVEIENYKKLVGLINQIRNEFSDIIRKTEFILIYKELKATNNFLDYLKY